MEWKIAVNYVDKAFQGHDFELFAHSNETQDLRKPVF